MSSLKDRIAVVLYLNVREQKQVHPIQNTMHKQANYIFTYNVGWKSKWVPTSIEFKYLIYACKMYNLCKYLFFYEVNDNRIEISYLLLILLRKRKSIRKNILHAENSSFGLIQSVYQWKWEKTRPSAWAEHYFALFW